MLVSDARAYLLPLYQKKFCTATIMEDCFVRIYYKLFIRKYR